MRNKHLYRSLKKKFGKRQTAAIMMCSRKKFKVRGGIKSLILIRNAFKVLGESLKMLTTEYNNINKVEDRGTDSDWQAHLEMDSIE